MNPYYQRRADLKPLLLLMAAPQPGEIPSIFEASNERYLLTDVGCEGLWFAGIGLNGQQEKDLVRFVGDMRVSGISGIFPNPGDEQIIKQRLSRFCELASLMTVATKDLPRFARRPNLTALTPRPQRDYSWK